MEDEPRFTAPSDGNDGSVPDDIPEPGTLVPDVDAAARATRSQTCREDCPDERDARCLMFMTRPPAMPA